MHTNVEQKWHFVRNGDAWLLYCKVDGSDMVNKCVIKLTRNRNSCLYLSISVCIGENIHYISIVNQKIAFASRYTSFIHYLELLVSQNSVIGKSMLIYFWAKRRDVWYALFSLIKMFTFNMVHAYNQLTRSTQRVQTSLAEADQYSHIAHCKKCWALFVKDYRPS